MTVKKLFFRSISKKELLTKNKLKDIYTQAKKAEKLNPFDTQNLNNTYSCVVYDEHFAIEDEQIPILKEKLLICSLKMSSSYYMTDILLRRGFHKLQKSTIPRKKHLSKNIKTENKDKNVY